MGPVSICIGQETAIAPLALDIIIPVTDDRIFRALMDIGHCLWRLGPAIVSELRGRVPIEPQKMALTGVCLLTKAVPKLETKCETKKTEPAIVLEALACPKGTRVLRIANGQIPTHLGLPNRVRCRAKGRETILLNCEHPVGRIEKLRRFKDHFHNMAITMPTRTARRIGMEKEDIHLGLRGYRKEDERQAKFLFPITLRIVWEFQ